jgi:enoyl-CoA hydratase
VRLEVCGGIGTIRLDRPPMNALSRRCADELRSAAQHAADHAGVRAVIVYGGEKVFAAGADIKEMETMPAADSGAGGGTILVVERGGGHPETDCGRDHGFRVGRWLRARAVL